MLWTQGTKIFFVFGNKISESFSCITLNKIWKARPVLDLIYARRVTFFAFWVELTESVDEIPKPISEKSKLALQFQTCNSAGTSWSFSGDVNCQERTYHSEIWVHDRYRLDQFTCQITVASLLSVWSEFPRSRLDIWSWSIAAALARKLTKRFCFNYFRYFLSILLR